MSDPTAGAEIATVIRDNGERAIVVTFTPDEWAAHVAAERAAGYDRAIAALRDTQVLSVGVYEDAADYLEATKETTL